MTPPLVSVVVPVYNTEPFLVECLDSLCRQTLTDIEILCVDDGSTDDSPAILRQFQQADSRIKIISQENGGLSSARNAAFSKLRGKYTLFVDSDDYVDAELCEKSVAKIRESDADAVFFYFDGYRNEHGKELWSIPFSSWSEEDRVDWKSRAPLWKYSSAWNRLYRTSFLRNNGIRFPEGLIFEDFPFHWKVMLLARRLSVVPEFLYHYRYRPNSISLQRSAKLMDIVPVTLLVRDWLQECGYYDVPEIRSLFVRQRLNAMWERFDQADSSVHPAFYAAIKESLDTFDVAVVDTGSGFSEGAWLFYDKLLAEDSVLSARQNRRFRLVPFLRRCRPLWKFLRLCRDFCRAVRSVVKGTEPRT